MTFLVHVRQLMVVLLSLPPATVIPIIPGQERTRRNTTSWITGRRGSFGALPTSRRREPRARRLGRMTNGPLPSLSSPYLL